MCIYLPLTVLQLLMFVAWRVRRFLLSFFDLRVVLPLSSILCIPILPLSHSVKCRPSLHLSEYFGKCVDLSYFPLICTYNKERSLSSIVSIPLPLPVKRRPSLHLVFLYFLSHYTTTLSVPLLPITLYHTRKFYFTSYNVFPHADASCDEDNGGCEQICSENSSTGVSCSCNEGYTLLPDGHSCLGKNVHVLFICR